MPSSTGPGKDPRRPALPGAGDAARGGGGGLHAGRGRPAPPRHGGLAPNGPHRAPPGEAHHPYAGERHRSRVRRARVPADPRLRRVRLSREPRRELRSHQLRHRLSSAALPGRVHLRSPERPAYGLLLRRHHHRGWQTPRRRVLPHRRPLQRLGLYDARRGRGGAHGAPLRERTRRERGREDRGGPEHRSLHVDGGFLTKGARQREGPRRPCRSGSVRRTREDAPGVSVESPGAPQGRPRRVRLPPETDVAFEDLGELERIAWDYEASSHSTRDTPSVPCARSCAPRDFPTRRPSPG